jgi:LacI family transcriptional regulator
VTRLTRNVVDGLLLVLPRNAEAYLETLHHRHFPHVLVDHEGALQNESAPSVRAMNWKGAYEATSYLLQLGHRRIACITGTMDMGCARERLAGYIAALQAYQVPILPELILEGDFLQGMGYQRTQELLALSEPPTAIFASSDLTAFGVMEAVRDQGLMLPRDISVVGFDDIPQATFVHPPLTTVRQPLEEMGSHAARLLLGYIEYPERAIEHIELPTELIIRQSCQVPTTERIIG